jgi:hypothetical protein
MPSRESAKADFAPLLRRFQPPGWKTASRAGPAVERNPGKGRSMYLPKFPASTDVKEMT